MTDSNHKYLKFSLIIFILFMIGCGKRFVDPTQEMIQIEKTYLTQAKVTITFSQVPTDIDISVPALKYNKDFVFGYHIDDGAADIYTHAFKLLNGGVIEGINYNGLAYTDGCGNDVKFKMSSSIYSMDNFEITDIHRNDGFNEFYIKWPQIVELYTNNWGVYNHGFTADPTLDPQYSITNNYNYIKSKTSNLIEGGIETRVFVNPDGNDSFTEVAFQQGYRISFVEIYEFGKPYVDVTTEWEKYNIRMGRTLLPSDFDLLQFVDTLAERSKDGVHLWGSTFNHSVTNADWGYDFVTFSSYMTAIADKYGKNGFDNIWMASEEETLDYCILKDLIVVNQSLTGNKLELTFSGNLPDDLRFYNTSLILTSNGSISSIEIEGASQTSSFNGINSNTSLINIDCTHL